MSVLVSGAPARSARSSVALSELDEVALVQRAQTGDRDAFGELYARHRDRVHRVLDFQLRDYPSDVDDVAADVFMKALESIGQVHAPDSGGFERWLNTIIRFEARNHRRWRARRREDELEPRSAGLDAMARRLLGPEDTAILHLELSRLLRGLPSQRRAVLVLRDWAGWSHDEIGQALGITPDTSCTVAVKARRQAREVAASDSPVADLTVCACGCGVAIRPGQRLYASADCERLARQQRRAGALYLDGDPADDPGVERLLTMIRSAGAGGVTRGDLTMSSHVPAARVERCIGVLIERGLITAMVECGRRNPITRYFSAPVAQPGVAA